MAKSAGTQFSGDDVAERGYSMRALRYVLLSKHYRLPMNFTWESLDAAARTVESLDNAVRGIREDAASTDDAALQALLADVEQRFLEALQESGGAEA